MEEKDIVQPHDAITKIVLHDPKNMLDFLSSLVVRYLPQDIQDDLILDRAMRQDTSHISAPYKKYFSDLLFHVPLRSGGVMRLYFLIEHKSYYDRLVPFQILKNITAIIEEQDKEPQPIIGFLFYHGGTKWNIPQGFQEAVGYGETKRIRYGRYMPELEFVAIRVKEDNLVAVVQPIRIKSFLSVLLISDAGEDKDQVFLDFLRIAQALKKTKEGLHFFDILLGYAKEVYKGDILNFSEKVGKEMGKLMEESVRTEGSEFFRQSQIKGFNMGEARGVRKGVKQEKEATARELIQEKLSPDLIQRVTKLSRKRLIELGLPSK